MSQNQQMQEVDLFLLAVEKQIKYKPIVPEVKKELLNHIEDKTDNYIENGLANEQAVYKAMNDIGTPEKVSSSFNAIYYVRPTWNIALPILIFLFIGFLRTYFVYGEYSIKLSLILGKYFFISVPLLFITLYLVYPLIINYTKIIFTLTFLLCAFSFLINQRSIINIRVIRDLYYRIPISSINLLILLLLIPIFSITAYYLCKNGLKGLLCSIALYAFIILLTNSVFEYYFNFIYKIIFTLVGLFALIYIVCNKYTSVNIKHAIALIIISFSTISFVWIDNSSGVFTENIQSFFKPEKTATSVFDDGYNSILLKELLKRTKLIGKVELTKDEMISYKLGTWYFDSIEDDKRSYLMQFLEEPVLDTILPQYSYNNYRITTWFLYYGSIPGVLLLTLILSFYCLLIYKILKIKNPLGKLIALSCYIALLLQTVIYILSNFGYQFGKIGTLPFISEGSASISANIILVGFIISAYRFDKVTILKNKLKKQYKNFSIV